MTLPYPWISWRTKLNSIAKLNRITRQNSNPLTITGVHYGYTRYYDGDTQAGHYPALHSCVFNKDSTLQAVANTHVGVNNKIFIPPKGSNKVIMPNVLNKLTTPPSQQAIRRTYTHRGIDLDNKELWIDFVAHGEDSPASGWAINANQGDKLGLMMKRNSKPVVPEVDNYVLIGDATALPVIGSILERLPSSASGQCVIEVHDVEDEQQLANPANLPITWVHNANPANGSQLADILEKISLPTQNRFAYVASEHSCVKAIRAFLKQSGWGKDEFFASSYWNAGID